MPIIGTLIHFIIAIFFAVHAVRSGQNNYWLFILFVFPLLGSVVYCLAIYIPNNYRLQRQGQQLVQSVKKFLDPTRELCEAKEEYEYTPTARNLLRLANALAESGSTDEAAATYDKCLADFASDDLNLKLGAARVYLQTNQLSKVFDQLDILRQEDPSFYPREVGILYAQALSADNNAGAAKAQFIDLMHKHPSFEVTAEYAIWAAEQGEAELATELKTEIEKITHRWTRSQRELNSSTIKRLKTAYNNLAKTN